MKRKQSGKPGASHLGQLTAAHGKGDFKAAKSHALMYANAVHKHMTASQTPQAGFGATEPDADEMGGASDRDADNVTRPPIMGGKGPTNPARSMLAKLAMMKRPK